jgi:hypothetical protein
MSSVTAVIGDTSSVGSLMFTENNGGGLDPRANIAFAQRRRNPAPGVARIRTVVAPHTVSDALGGYISADFTIPAEEALRWRPVLRLNAVCWLFDGGTPIFFGYLQQPVWTQTGDCQITLAGGWALLGTSRKREAWDLWDMTLLTKGTGANENKSGSVNVNSDGSITLSIPASTLAGSDRCSVDLLLFGEVAFGNDDKLITAFEFDIKDASNFGVNRRFRVIGKANAAGATGDQLWDSAPSGAAGSSGVQGSLNLAGTNQSGAWPSGSYRCLRFEIVNTAGSSTIAADWYVTLARIRISTRESLFVAGGSTMDSGAVARDVLTFGAGVGSGATGMASTSLQTDLPQEFWPSSIFERSPDRGTNVYLYGLDPRIPLSSAPNSGVGITGFTALEWQSPADILTALVAIDGCHCGLYLPYNGRGGYDAPGWVSSGGFGADVGSSWLSAPPMLTYQAFTDPVTNPDYLIFTRQGATVEPAADAQPLISMEYINYQNLRGRQLSVVDTDANTKNYAYAQGWRRAEDYSIQPAVGDQNLAASLGQQQLQLRRQPVSAATITIENDGSTRTPILKAGATIPRLAMIRPGSAHIVDMNAGSGLRSGYVTHVEWWGQTLTSNERAELTLSEPPGRPGKRRQAGIIVNRYQRTRTGILSR